MDLHVIGGFLGSGKTTAIINALKTFLAKGQRVGVITNDKGRYLVDTAFLGTVDIPTAEVPGGCFRCNYGDFQKRIAQLQAEARPEVLFAESVGSCVDLVGPVLTPLANLSSNAGMRVTYSVFVDIRLLRRYLAGQELPFSDNITYIFGKQLEEANILVINKADLLSSDDSTTVLAQTQSHFPNKTLLLQSSLTPEGVATWLSVLAKGHPLPPALEIDYKPYIAGGAELAWCDEQITFLPPNGHARAMILRIIVAIVNVLRQAAYPVAHLKFFVQDADHSVKLSFTGLDTQDWEGVIPHHLRAPVTLTINARVEMPAEGLRQLIGNVLHTELDGVGVVYTATGENAFSPVVPMP